MTKAQWNYNQTYAEASFRAECVHSGGSARPRTQPRQTQDIVVYDSSNGFDLLHDHAIHFHVRSFHNAQNYFALLKSGHQRSAGHLAHVVEHGPGL